MASHGLLYSRPTVANNGFNNQQCLPNNAETCFHGKDSLGPAGASSITVFGTHSALAADAFIAAEAVAQTSAAVAHSLVGALSPRMQI